MCKYVDIHSHHKESSPDLIRIVSIRADGSLPVHKLEYVSYGIHPWDSTMNGIEQTLVFTESIKSLCAIGECGLDKNKGAELERQIELFRRHINISEKLELPVIIHCVGRFNELIAIRKEGRYSQPWIVHGFRGHSQLALQLVKNGILLSFGEALLQEGSKASESLKALQPVQWFLESDESNADIKAIYKRAALLTGTPLNVLKEQLFNNFLSTFAVQK